MLIFVLYVLCYINYAQLDEQRFKCLVKTKAVQTFFLNLTFHCNKQSIVTRGCFKEVTIEYLNYGNYLATFNANLYQKDVVFSFTGKTHSEVILKLKTAKYQQKTNLKPTIPHNVELGVPIALNNAKLEKLYLDEISMYVEYKKQLFDMIHEKRRLHINMGYLLHVSYEISNYRVRNITIKDQDFYLILCEEKFEYKRGRSKIDMFQNWMNEVINRKYPDEITYNHYLKMYSKSEIIKQHTELRTVIFLERLDKYYKMIGNMFDNSNMDIAILPSFEEHYSLMFIGKRIFCIFPPIDDPMDYEMILNYNSNIISMFELKKIDNTGTHIRRK